MYNDINILRCCSIEVGCDGCSFSRQCDLRSGIVYNHCGDDLDSGYVSAWRLYNKGHPTGKTIEDYLMGSL